MEKEQKKASFLTKLDKKLVPFEIFDGFMLKIIAAASMLIDHIGYIFATQLPFHVYTQMRIIGRVSFPIFAFLLVEGFVHTKNRINYLARLLGFGVTMIFCLEVLRRMGVQVPVVVNVFITLGIGFIAIWFIEQYWETSSVITVFLVLGITLFADLLHADYGSYGVAIIIAFYLFRNTRILSVLVFSLLTALSVFFDYSRNEYFTNFTQLYAIAAVPFLLLYNGEPGRYRFKYFFYVFYPLHIIILMLIRYVLYRY